MPARPIQRRNACKTNLENKCLQDQSREDISARPIQRRNACKTNVEKKCLKDQFREEMHTRSIQRRNAYKNNPEKKWLQDQSVEMQSEKPPTKAGSMFGQLCRTLAKHWTSYLCETCTITPYVVWRLLHVWVDSCDISAFFSRSYITNCVIHDRKTPGLSQGWWLIDLTILVAEDIIRYVKKHCNSTSSNTSAQRLRRWLNIP